MEEKLYGNIGGKIKRFASWLLVIGIIAGVIWLVVSVVTYSKCAEDLESYMKYGNEVWQDGAMSALTAKKNITNSIILMVSSFFGSYPVYAFGQIVEDINGIHQKMCEPGGEADDSTRT